MSACSVPQAGYDKRKSDKWAHIAPNMKKTFRDYDPQGMVVCMDVFYAKSMLGHGLAPDVEDSYDGYI